MFNRNQYPILIVVANGRWDAYGPITLRTQELTRILTEIGGVSDSVPEGNYHFNVKNLLGLWHRASLKPVKK